jgi:hypothetical protein
MQGLIQSIIAKRSSTRGSSRTSNENPRDRKSPKRGRKRLFNAAIHSLRLCVERTFAWEDKFKRLLLRPEFKQQRHYGVKLMAYTLINLRYPLWFLKLARSAGPIVSASIPSIAAMSRCASGFPDAVGGVWES